MICSSCRGYVDMFGSRGGQGRHYCWKCVRDGECLFDPDMDEPTFVHRANVLPEHQPVSVGVLKAGSK